MKVLVFGYSDNPDRYSNRAYNLLLDYKHEAIKFNPRVDDENALGKEFDTITIYVNKTISDSFETLILSLKCRRAIFNPGTENPLLEKKLEDSGVEVVHGCTLVMLRTGQF